MMYVGSYVRTYIMSFKSTLANLNVSVYKSQAIKVWYIHELILYALNLLLGLFVSSKLQSNFKGSIVSAD